MPSFIDLNLYYDFSLFFSSQEDFGGDATDLYDDVLAVPSSTGNGNGPDNSQSSVAPIDRIEPSDINGGSYGMSNNMNHLAKRHQLYIGNLTWVYLLNFCFYSK